MNCPVDENQALEAVTLAEGLPAHRCAVCTGVWLNSTEYLRWVLARPALVWIVPRGPPRRNSVATGADSKER
jgi:hypothetical protein